MHVGQLLLKTVDAIVGTDGDLISLSHHAAICQLLTDFFLTDILCDIYKDAFGHEV